MSNILKKDRKPSEMKVIIHGEEIAKDIMKIVNDDSKIPKRQRIILGARLVDHSLNSYEDLRAANMIFPDTKKKMSNRLRLGHEAEIEANKLNSDLRIIPAVINVIDENEHEVKWYKELVDKTIKYEKELNHWNRGEVSRANKVYNDSVSNRKKDKDTSSSQLESIPSPKSNIINIEDINSNDYIKNKLDTKAN